MSNTSLASLGRYVARFFGTRRAAALAWILTNTKAADEEMNEKTEDLLYMKLL